MEFITQPWPWYVAGPLIALVMLTLIYFGNTFGMSSNLRTLCTLGGAGKWSAFFRFNWRSQTWNLMVLIGVVMGGFLAVNVLSNESPVQLAMASVAELESLGFSYSGNGLLPPEIYNWDNVLSFKGMGILLLGGMLIGFGTRYAGGCTSGHAITGLSNLQLPSLIAVIGFFIGGLFMTHIILPLIFSK